MTTQSDSIAPATSWCQIADPATVEARFGLKDCGPRDSGGNRCTMEIPAWARDGHHSPVGALMVLADHILGELPYRVRPPDTWSLTAELTVDVISDMSDTDVLHAQAEVVASANGPFVRCSVTDSDGGLVAVGTTRAAYVPATTPGSAEGTSTRPVRYPASDDFAEVLGLTIEHLADASQITLSDPANWVNGFGIMHGGVSACISVAAATAAVTAQNPELSTAHVHVSYLRPVVVGAPFVATGRLRHIGRSSAVVEVLGHAGNGQLCTVSTVTARRHNRAR